jgi:uncharacterized membrane protein YdbT with pleckstrin-like domain
MSFTDTHLLPGETVTFRTRLHWKVYFLPICAAILLVAGGVWLLRSTAPDWLAIIPALLALLVLSGPWLKRRTSEFAVTNKRVVVKLGVLSTRSLELLLPKIEAITVEQTLMGRLLGYGEIIVTGSGGTNERFVGIQAPLRFRQAVQAASDDAAGDPRSA